MPVPGCPYITAEVVVSKLEYFGLRTGILPPVTYGSSIHVKAPLDSGADVGFCFVGGALRN